MGHYFNAKIVKLIYIVPSLSSGKNWLPSYERRISVQHGPSVLEGMTARTWAETQDVVDASREPMSGQHGSDSLGTS